MPAKFAIDGEVRDVLKKATIEPRAVTLNGQLERGLYDKVAKVLKGAGGKWSRKDNAHRFDRDPRELLGLAIETGVATNRKTEFQSFYTPDDVADQVAELAEVTFRGVGLTRKQGGPGLLVNTPRILEPSIGGGALVRAAYRKNPMIQVTGYDIDEEAITRLRAEKNPYLSLNVKDFLTVEPRVEFDRVLMNPPFVKGSDVRHVSHAFKFLLPGGILVAIVSASAGLGQTKVQREFVDLFKEFRTETTLLPPGAFSDAGTNVRTKILKIWARS